MGGNPNYLLNGMILQVVSKTLRNRFDDYPLPLRENSGSLDPTWRIIPVSKLVSG